MTSRLQTILKSIVLFGFSVIVIAVFRYFSMLRPGAYGALYKEMIAGGIVLAICFLNYFILYPLFYTKRRFLFYVISIVLSTLVATFLEVVLVYPQIKDFPSIVSEVSPQEYFTAMSISLFLRDLCFVIFFFIISLLEGVYDENKDVNIMLQDTDNLLLARKDTKEQELVTVRLEDIAYCQQDENYAYIYLTNGTKVYRNCSLKSLHEQLTNSRAVRISRKIVVFYRHIVSYDNNTVYVDVFKEGVSVGFEITDAFRQQALQMLKKHCIIVEKKEPNSVSEITTVDMILTSHNIQQTEKDAAQTDNSPKLEDKLSTQQLLSFIKSHPDCKGTDIMDHFGVSLSTVNRTIRQLRKEGLIEYSGSKKTGGYHAIEPPTA